MHGSRAQAPGPARRRVAVGGPPPGQWDAFQDEDDPTGFVGTRSPVRATVSGSTLRLIVTSLTMINISSAMSRL